ncbi:hypothetical protein VTN02DRAFT_1646 [Thermoascus thermophilus]
MGGMPNDDGPGLHGLPQNAEYVRLRLRSVSGIIPRLPFNTSNFDPEDWGMVESGSGIREHCDFVIII